jgi:proteasome lid subunit RPN8/RPN11
LNSSTPQAIILPRRIVDEMLAHVKAGYPDEACGVLADANGTIVKHYPATNAAERPDDFSIIGPEEAIRINNEIDQNDWNYFAYYHSHPRSQAYPSSRDIDYAGYSGLLYIIFSLRDFEHPEMRAFTIHRDRSVSEHPIIIEP